MQHSLPTCWICETQPATVQLFVIALHHLEYTRNRIASAVLLFYWLFVLVADVIKLRTLILSHQPVLDAAQFGMFAVSSSLSLIMFILENIPRPKSQYVMLEEDAVSFAKGKAQFCDTPELT